MTGENADIGDMSNIGDVIDEVVKDVNPITKLNNDNFETTTGISGSNSSTTNEPEANEKPPSGWIVTSDECKNRDECDKVKQTIVESIDEIKVVTNDTVQFGTVQTSDRNWLMTH